MIIKITAEAAKMPCNQRARVLIAEFNRVIVELCGTNQVLAIEPTAIIGVELSDQLAISFGDSRTFHGSNHGSKYPHDAS